MENCKFGVGWSQETWKHTLHVITYIHSLHSLPQICEGDPQNGILFWRSGPLLYRLHPLGVCSRNPSVSVYHLVLLWEAEFGFSEFFFEHSYNMFAHFMMMIYEPTCPHHAECTAVFDQKQHDPHVPPSLFTESYSKGHFIFVSPDEESPQREMFCQCERGETKKMTEALKAIKIDEFRNCLEQLKKVSIGVLHWMESTLTVTEVQTCKNIQFL